MLKSFNDDLKKKPLHITFLFCLTLVNAGCSETQKIPSNDASSSQQDSLGNSADGSVSAQDKVLPKPCNGDFDCEPGACDKDRNVCVACYDGYGCPPKSFCHKQQCVPTKVCYSSTDCKTTQQVCEDGNFLCVDCLTTDDCPQNQECIEKKCQAVATCKSDKDCSAVCNKDKGWCVDCVSSADCKADEFCTSWGTCDPTVCSNHSCAETALGTRFFKCRSDGAGYQNVAPCDDKDECTIDTCDVVKGCSHSPKSGGNCGSG